MGYCGYTVEGSLQGRLLRMNLAGLDLSRPNHSQMNLEKTAGIKPNTIMDILYGGTPVWRCRGNT